MVRFEREKERRIAAHRRAVLRKESQIGELSRRLRDIQTRRAQEKTTKATQTAQDLSNLRNAQGQEDVALDDGQSSREMNFASLSSIETGKLFLP